MGAKWIKIAVVYFILGIAVGLFMSSTIQLQWAAAHAHVNLAGWASVGITGAIYSLYPKAGNSTLGKWHFWLYNIGLPFLLLSMFMIQVRPGPFAGWGMLTHIFTFGGGTAVAVGVILFIANVFLNVRASDRLT
ncbi:hypothetical protein GCM10007063_27770 [Lentibacillus kapialis]|uniref:Cytochrome-c oxidase n=2 Tax=Lentibacillus kapialis TaxID=340214 RepID=A0A917Q0Q3_9BACI|nr:hypothetical protein GCM10007063_27770 [Lentibacillus kapialis]